MDFGSSLLDMAVAQEQQSGRQVFMDFNRNPEAVPGDLPFSLDRLDDDVRAYLEITTLWHHRPSNGCNE